MASELFTDRLHLRPWRAADAEPHRELWTERDRRSLRLIDADGRPTVEVLRRRMAEEARDAETGLTLYAVERRADADFIGYCGLIVGQATVDEPEIAYELARRIHGNGYATEAARRVVEEAISAGHTRLWATVREWNTPSLRVLEKVGFYDSGRRTPDPARGDTIWMTIDLVVPLRERLARAVESSRRAALARQPRTGRFSSYEEAPKIVFAIRGRITGLPREKWWLPFAPDGDVLYLIEEQGRRADWIRNLLADPAVELDGVQLVGRVVDDLEEIARARQVCGARFARRGLLAADLVERGLVVAFEAP